MKKLISLLLVLATLLSCFMLTVSADDFIVSDEGRLPFEDVKDSHWFYSSVGFCYANDIIKGMNEYTFGWNGNLTRAQFLQLLATIDGADLTQYSVTKFEDVKTNHWYYGAVAWAYENNITNGVTETKFAPNQAVTRAQIARMMNIYMESKYSVEVTEDCLDEFNDADKIRDWAVEGIRYVVSAGLISGMEMNGKLCVNPDGTTTRAQAAVIFRNFILNYYYGECEHEFTEAACTESAVCGKCGLVNGLPMGHILTAYDCVTGGKCSVCEAEVEPSKLIHDFAAATCAKPRTCKLCGITRGEPTNGHDWWAATCTNPKMCKVCYKTEGKALGHTTQNGMCSRCKKENFTSKYRQAAYYMVKKATPDGEGHYVLADGFNDANLYEMAYGVYYDAHEGMFGLTLMFVDLYDGSTYSYTMVITENSDICDIVAFGYDVNGNSLGEAVGTLKPSEAMPSNLGIKWTVKTGTKGFDSFLSNRGATLISNSNSLLKRIGCDISAFGFNVDIW